MCFGVTLLGAVRGVALIRGVEGALILGDADRPPAPPLPLCAKAAGASATANANIPISK